MNSIILRKAVYAFNDVKSRGDHVVLREKSRDGFVALREYVSLMALPCSVTVV